MTAPAARKRIAASGRLDVLREPAPGAPCWVHRWMGEGFAHKHGDGASKCLCKPYYVPADDPRTLDEIVDDMEDQEAAND